MAAATMYVTPSGAGAKDGTTWATAFGEAEFEADLEANAEPGDIYYIQAGTYTLDSAYSASARDATAAEPICIIGVKAATTNEPPVLSDWGSGTDRPTFACGSAYGIVLGDYYKVLNCIFTGSFSAILTVTSYTLVYNCKSTNSSGTASRTAFDGSTSFFIGCEGISTNGYAWGSCGKAIYCYAHDSVRGITGSANGVYLFNIFDTCSAVGLEIASTDIETLFGNTFYNCTTAVNATDAYAIIGINNIIDTATDGFLWTSLIKNNVFAYNHAGNSVTDMWDTVEETVVPHKDNWVTSGDPDFTDEAGGNFSLEGTSPCINAGMAMQLAVG